MNNMKIFITGISSGIGRELTIQLLDKGHELWGIARRSELLESLKQEVSSVRLRTTECDTTNEEQIQRTLKLMREEGFTPDTVILNAAIDPEDMREAFSFPIAKNVLSVNTLGALRWVDAFLPEFQKRKTGQFIALSSLSALWPDTSSASYAASKAALSMAFRSLRLRFKDTHIRYKTIFLGPVDTEIKPRFHHNHIPARSHLIASPQNAADFIMHTLTQKGDNFYFPRYLKILAGLNSLIPDMLFETLTKHFRR